MADLYARYAWSAYSEGNWDEFRDLTATGVEFDALNPDLLSFQGIIYRNDSRFYDASVSFEKSYQQEGDTNYLGKMEILAILGEIYFRLGEDRALIDLYTSVDRMYTDNPDLLFYTVQSYFREGLRERANALAEEGVYRFQDQRFLILLSSWQPNSGYPAILAEFIERQGLLFPDLLARTIIDSRSENKKLMYLYIGAARDLNSWYFSTRYLNIRTESHLLPEVDPRRVWPVEVIKAVWEENNPSSLLRGLDLKVPVRVDTSEDGFPNWELISTGEDYIWLNDENQDGATDFRILWNPDLSLKSIENFNRDYRILCNYNEYPSVESVNISGPGRTVRTYLFLPSTYSLPMREGTGISWEELIDLDVEDLPLWLFAGEAYHLKACYSLKDRVQSGNDSLFRDYTVIDGKISRFREDSNFDGHFDRTVLLEDWMPVKGYRDLDLDGTFDLEEVYQNGRLTSLKVQGDRSRIEEYYDLWNSKRYQLWDFDRTSFYDAALIQESDLSWTETKLNDNVFMQLDSGE